MCILTVPMSFFAPVNLLWLLPFIGTLLALYFLRPRHRNVPVSSLFLWEAIAQSSRSDKPFQKLKLSLLLLLQLLALLLIIFALAQPFTKPRPVASLLYVIVLDQSAGMKATDILPSRYSEAQDQATSFVRDQMKAEDRAIVIGAGNVPEVLCQQTSSKGGLIAAINASQPADTMSDIGSAVSLAHTIARRANAILLYSDASWGGDIDQYLNKQFAGRLQVIPIGTTDPVNAGIVGISSRSDFLHPANAPSVLVKFDRHNSPTGVLTISLNNKTVYSSAYPAGSGELTRIVPIPALSAGGIVKAKLIDMKRDDLAVDNSATLVVKPNNVKKILLVFDNDTYLERALALLPNTQLYEIKPSEYTNSSESYDLVVYDGWLPTILPPGPALVFNAVSADMPVVATGASQIGGQIGGQIVDWDEADPLLSYVELADTHVTSYIAVQTSSWGNVVADLPHGPAIVKGTRQNHSIVWFSFSPTNTDLTSQAAFPILLSNCVDVLTQGQVGVTQEHHTGTSYVLPMADNGWSVTGPNGVVTLVQGDADTGCVVTNTNAAGIYTARSGDAVETFAFNLSDPSQSDISVKEHTLLNVGAKIKPWHALARVDLVPWIAAAALMAILVEWLVYHRSLRYTKAI